MFLKPCRCGARKMNFKFDIGPYFVGECCENANAEDEPTTDNQVADVPPTVPASTVPQNDVYASANDIDLSEAEKLEDEPITQTDEETRIQDIVAAISLLEPTDFNKTNKDPKVEALEKLVGYNITAAERDIAWQLVQNETAS